MRRILTPLPFVRRPCRAAARWCARGLAFVAVAGCPLLAQRSLTLDEVLAQALGASPDLRTAWLRADSAHAEQRIARALPVLALATIPAVPFQYSATVPLDIGPERIFRTRVAARGLDAALADTADTRRQVVFAARQGFYDILLGEALRDIAREQRDILRQLLAADSVRLRTGDVPARDVTKSEVELARAEADLTRTDAQVHAAKLSLQLLMGSEHPDTLFSVSGRLAYRAVDVPVDSLGVLAELGRADIVAAHERTEQSRAALSLANASLVPTPLASLVYQRGLPFDNGSNYAVGIGISMPLFSWSAGERERGRAGLESARVAERRTHAQVANDVQTALDAYRAARALAERYEGGLVAKSEAALETARYAYRTGAASLLELIEAIRTYAAIRSDQANAVHDYWVGVYALSRATGRDLVP
ncbi:MAG: TolC family protein [Gemmatimonadales bacterium]